MLGPCRPCPPFRLFLLYRSSNTRATMTNSSGGRVKKQHAPRAPPPPPLPSSRHAEGRTKYYHSMQGKRWYEGSPRARKQGLSLASITLARPINQSPGGAEFQTGGFPEVCSPASRLPFALTMVAFDRGGWDFDFPLPSSDFCAQRELARPPRESRLARDKRKISRQTRGTA
jgi:hypothetical protein